MSAPTTHFPPTRPGVSAEAINKDAGDLVETARHDLDDLGQEVKDQAAAIGDEAKAQLDDAVVKAKGMASEQKELLAGQLGGLTEALHKVAGELEGQDTSTAGYVRSLADGADRLTSTVRDNDVDAIIGMAQDFGRKQPVAFMGAAALLGFAASRFVLASASRPSGATKPAAGTGTGAEGQKSPQGSAPSYSQTVGGGDAGI